MSSDRLYTALAILLPSIFVLGCAGAAVPGGADRSTEAALSRGDTLFLRTELPSDSVVLTQNGYEFVVSEADVERYVDRRAHDPEGEFFILLRDIRRARREHGRRLTASSGVEPYLLADLAERGRISVREPGTGGLLRWIRLVEEVHTGDTITTKGRTIFSPSGDLILRVTDSVARS